MSIPSTPPGAPTSPRLDATALQQWAEQLLLAAGTAAASADDTARLLLRTNLRGIDTHGLARLPAYVAKLRTAETRARPQMHSEWREQVLHLDGDGGLGQAVGAQAVRELAQRAQEQAVATALIRRSGHLGALGVFVLELAEQGLVALMCQDTPPLMGLPGSRQAAIGNNPLAFAAPVAGRAPLVFDMAASVVARGNVLQAQRDQSASIPAGWAIGPDGEPTTDTATALAGAMLPMAGHKGIGLAMLVQVLAGSLNGVAAQASALGGSPANVSGFMLVINPARLLGREAFDAHMSAWLQHYLAASGRAARYPGERAAQSELRLRAEGIALPDSVLAELRATGAALDCPFIA